MPRIRSVKPEFFDSPGTAKASPWARLLFVAMWCWADDWGIGDAHPGRLLAFAFPHDAELPWDFRGIARELTEAYGVQWYEADGRPWYAIPSWEKHQRTDKRAAKRHPTPDQAERWMYADPPESPGIPGENPHGSVEQGNRGTGDKYSCSTPPASSVRVHRFADFWEAYPRHVGRKKAETKYAAAVKRADEDTIIEGARKLADDPNLPEKQFIPYPATWLERDGWTDEPLPSRNGTTKPAERPRRDVGVDQWLA